ncbi:hypothetical protein GTZ99_05640 [Novosphingobium sp. FSY-8]|uniref:Uncharacterized protein n=1 Tax=Novosphingobium ovatum TaxID=1908523 RepID=A0ABW9XC18_9SPHN|nr:hypothetical protein [Novosphingobium ovatum]NBC36037.1 hypothetical protein [Novosphingobium ovatum]
MADNQPPPLTLYELTDLCDTKPDKGDNTPKYAGAKSGAKANPERRHRPCYTAISPTAGYFCVSDIAAQQRRWRRIFFDILIYQYTNSDIDAA